MADMAEQVADVVRSLEVFGDIGPHTCAIMETHCTRTLEYIEFMDRLAPGVARLYELLEEYKTLDVKAKLCLVPESLARWIFANNQLEHTGLPSEGDTIHYLLSCKPPTTTAEREVSYMLELLKTTYDKDLPLHARTTTPSKIQGWHTILGRGQAGGEAVFADPGIIRVAGAKSTPIPDVRPKEHYYPHHNVIPSGLAIFAQKVALLLQEVEKEQDPQQKLLYTFGIAAFVQYYYVDIHPFEDGNGRLCRFLSKYILDGVLPVPFPYPYSLVHRTHYLKALVHGSAAQPIRDAPLGLATFMLNAALEFYSDVITGFKGKTAFFVVGSWEIVLSQVVGIIPALSDANKAVLKQAYDALSNKTTTFINIADMPFELRKFELEEDDRISLDDL